MEVVHFLSSNFSSLFFIINVGHLSVVIHSPSADEENEDEITASETMPLVETESACGRIQTTVRITLQELFLSRETNF